MITQALRLALYTALHGANLTDADGTACGVFDEVSQKDKPPMPYLAFEDTTSEPWDTDTSNGAETVTDLRVFSNKRGAKNAAHVADQVHTLLHHQPLTVDGAQVVIVECLSVQLTRGDDGATREAVIRVRVLLDEITASTT